MFAQLFPGFVSEGAVPLSDIQGEPQALEQIDLSRGGRGVFPVGLSVDAGLTKNGPIWGSPILKLPRQGGGSWYLADNYFVQSVDSTYASIPRPQKLALWDYFFSLHPKRLRILGVFPISMLRDRQLLAPDGYTPAVLNEATIVVYTTNLDSAITEEMDWRTPDDLVKNGRDYADGAFHVQAFNWSSSRWSLVPTATR